MPRITAPFSGPHEKRLYSLYYVTVYSFYRQKSNPQSAHSRKVQFLCCCPYSPSPRAGCGASGRLRQPRQRSCHGYGPNSCHGYCPNLLPGQWAGARHPPKVQPPAIPPRCSRPRQRLLSPSSMVGPGPPLPPDADQTPRTEHCTGSCKCHSALRVPAPWPRAPARRRPTKPSN